MGKRVDFSARSVITPDPNISVGELGVPEKIAMNQTFPETVDRYNKYRLYEYVLNGPNHYPGARRIKKNSDGRIIALEMVEKKGLLKKEADELEEGDVVHRHIIDGDYVLFNRQPSLHKMSMMAHKVRVMPFNTFRLNVTVTTPYNADFDGDEMNTHFPQSILSSIELKYLAAVPHQIISPAHSSPIIKPVQDTLLGFYKMTGKGVYFNKRDAMNLLGKVSRYTGQLPEPDVPNSNGEMKFWSGHSIVSTILPEINFYAVDDKDPNNINIIEIVRGKLLRGQIKTSQSGKILHIIYNDFGTKVATEYLDNLQRLITAFLVRTGFSVGPRDLIIPNNVRQTVKKVIAKGVDEVNEIQKQIHLGTFNDPSEPDNHTAYENKIRGITSKIESTVENIVLKTADKDNRILQAVTSGSKGSSFNYRQMVGIVGGQYIDNKRIPFGFSDRTRSLPHYYRYDASLEAKGFVAASFIEGLNPKEFFFHAMGGREGLIDTAVKTAESGYVQRRLIKAMEDLKVCYDYSVRNSTGDIYQTLYGEDGMDPVGLLEEQKINYLYYSQDKMAQEYRLQETENWDVFMNKQAITSMKKNKKWKQILDMSFEKLIDVRDHMIKYVFQNKYIKDIMAPVNIQRTIINVSRRFDINKKAKTDLDPVKVVLETEKLIEKLNTHGSPNSILHMIIRFNLAPKNMVFNERFTDDAFMYIIALIERQYIKSRVSISEMVGPISAQSIGEISTQLTLNTFHKAGASSAVTTGGVARLKELMACSKNIKTASMKIYLDENTKYDKLKSIQVLKNLELTTIKDLFPEVSIYLDSNLATNIPEDEPLVDLYKTFNVINKEKSENPWVIRIKFNKQKMVEKNLTMFDIGFILQQNHSNISAIYTDDNADQLILRAKVDFEVDGDNIDKDMEKLVEMEKKIVNTIIKGIIDVSHVVMDKEKDNLTWDLETQSYQPKEEWVLTTIGTNLEEALLQEHVDPNRSYTNDINEIYNVLGVEAARNSIFKEFEEVIVKKGGSSLNDRHLGLLADYMTHKGFIMPIDRHGINRNPNVGPLAKSSFEETTDQLLRAGLFGDYDDLKGVSSNIIMGQMTRSGTGDSELLLDEEMINASIKVKDVDMEQEEDGEKLFEKYLNVSDYCQEGVNIGFDIGNLEGDNIKLSDIPKIKPN
jgi:DNA-directed RNA polymerase II subunit RPB1